MAPPGQRSSFRPEREFGLLVGGVLVGLGLWWHHRQKLTLVVPGALSLGGALVLLGALAPRALRWPRRGWMALAEALGRVSALVTLLVVYFVVLTPIGVAKRLGGWDPLRRRAPAERSYWRPYPARQRDPRHYERMS